MSSKVDFVHFLLYFSNCSNCFQGKCVSIKLKLVTFESFTRAQTVPFDVQKFDDIYPVSKRLLENEIKTAKGNLRLRLMGLH